MRKCESHGLCGWSVEFWACVFLTKSGESGKDCKGVEAQKDKRERNLWLRCNTCKQFFLFFFFFSGPFWTCNKWCVFHLERRREKKACIRQCEYLYLPAIVVHCKPLPPTPTPECHVGSHGQCKQTLYKTTPGHERSSVDSKTVYPQTNHSIKTMSVISHPVRCCCSLAYKQLTRAFRQLRKKNKVIIILDQSVADAWT